MLKGLSIIITDILASIYESLIFSILLAFFFMFFYMFSQKCGWKILLKQWIQEFKNNRLFRYVFLLVLCVVMILFRTLFNRNLWLNPLSDVMGGWWLYDNDGKFTTEAFENILLLVPFTILLFVILDMKRDKRCVGLFNIVFYSIKYASLFSLMIEFLQLMLRLGTFQLSDLVYNSLGGVIGGIFYYVGCKLKKHFESTI